MANETGSAEARPTAQDGTKVAEAGIEPAPACTFVIFGAHGDLTKRLLMPAFYNLSCSKLLAGSFRIVGVDRVDATDDAWRGELTQTMQEFTRDPDAEFYTPKIDEQGWGWLTQRMSYVRADFTNADDIARLGKGLSGNVIFYLAVAGRFFGGIVEQLGQSGLLKQDGGFRRVVIEKPFGHDLASAKALNAQILGQGDEAQFFRIDHFLGKETIQNIMALRFANGIFEPLWRRDHIDYVEITAAETIGVESRGAFYEPTGALRDMVPNHLFQMLSMVAMEPPNSFEAEAVRTEKARLVEATRPVKLADVVHGQYTAGAIGDAKVPAYRDEPNVARDSTTETYIALKLMVDNWRWAGVPFYLRTGKRLAARRTEIVVHFKPAPYAMFKNTPVDQLTRNNLTLNIQPRQGLTLSLSGKVPGPKMELSEIDLRFRYEDAFKIAPNVGYETLLYDCMIGDATLFQRADNIEAGWAVVDPTVKDWSRGKTEPAMYASGSEGPDAADALLAAAGHGWTKLVR